MALWVGVLVLCLSAVSALPWDPVLRKLDDLRYQHVEGPDGKLYLSDSWLKASDLQNLARYDPDRQIVYHLFTRSNPSWSQPIISGNSGHLWSTNFAAWRRTIVLIHGWRNSVTSDFNTVLVPAFLAAADLNVIVVDWGVGAGNLNYFTALANVLPSGLSVARFLSWLNSASNTRPANLHIVGHSLGGHMAGIVGRNLGRQVGYITALDPAYPGWITNNDRFSANDGVYTEVIHTNAGVLGFLTPLGHVDFYPNGGIDMPGCNSQDCDHGRCFHYMAESVRSGGFTGRRCESYTAAMRENCNLSGTLRMGGLNAKTGSSGVYHLVTNASPPFSRG